ncbi:serine O-acetyltransferase [Priestia aryabhattai]|uniref:serine O-acetyltransferase n=1 Tax=Priestia aryabhattai TaxID=412384 RepID=UPI001C8D2A65|nr:serine O-acetyltransferase [Priestia aryabhattai]MBX9988616.1 serine acetyltransferase [Priestia aryabhattai]
MLDSIKKDLKACGGSPLLAIISNRGFHSLLNYRVANYLHKKKVPLIPLALTRIIQITYGIDIDYRAKIGSGCCIVHGVGTVVGCGAVIGENAKIYHGVTLGIADSPNREDGFPTVGDNALIGAGAKLLGKINIGDQVRIGANSVVINDIPNNCSAFGIPAKYKELKLIQPVQSCEETNDLPEIV